MGDFTANGTLNLTIAGAFFQVVVARYIGQWIQNLFVLPKLPKYKWYKRIFKTDEKSESSGGEEESEATGLEAGVLGIIQSK